MILSIDPGIRGCGVALFGGDRLVAAAYVKNTVKKGNRLSECAKMAYALALWTKTIGEDEVTNLICEFPVVYSGRAARGDANDLFPLAAIDGALVALFPRADVTSYFPREWKSNVDADTMIERIKLRLSPEELTCVELPSKSLQHNVWDGIGVGLHFLGRLQPKRIFARE
jgi:hypothetical protein